MEIDGDVDDLFGGSPAICLKVNALRQPSELLRSSFLVGWNFSAHIMSSTSKALSNVCSRSHEASRCCRGATILLSNLTRRVAVKRDDSKGPH